MKKMMRHVRNVWDGKYTIIGTEDNDREKRTAGGVREAESRVIRKMLDVGLAIPQTETGKSAKR